MSLSRRDFVKLCTGTAAGYGVSRMFHPAVREALDYDGLSVIVAREPCPLHHKRQSGKGAKVVFGVDQSLCDHCRLCIKEYGCPAFQPEGDTVVIDPTQCSGCAVCVQVCPQRAIKPVK